MKNDITWGSHIPLHKSIFNVFPISGAAEFGAGIHSTKVFFENTPQAISIETDLHWVNHVKENVGEDQYHKIIHLEIEGVERATRERNVNKVVIDNALDQSKKILQSREYINHMFVDSISCLRYRLLTELYDKFDIVTFHDYWSPGLANHYRGGWAMKNPNYQMYIDKSYQVNTGMVVHRSLVHLVPELKHELQKQLNAYHPAAENLVKVKHGNKF